MGGGSVEKKRWSRPDAAAAAEAIAASAAAGVTLYHGGKNLSSSSNNFSSIWKRPRDLRICQAPIKLVLSSNESFGFEEC